MKIIYENPDGGVSVVIPAPGVEPANLISSVVPYGASWDIVEDDAVPADRTFRTAWRRGESGVCEDLDASKAVAHDIRRAKRSEEFRPHDELMAARIPGTDEVAVEAARQEIRDRYVVIEEEIDAAEEVEDLRVKVKSL